MRVFYPVSPDSGEMTYMEVPDDFTNEQISQLIDLEWEQNASKKREE